MRILQVGEFLKEVAEERKNVELFKCDGCGKEFPPEGVIIGDDPYLAEICDRHEETCLCKECHYQRCMDI